MSNRIKLVTNWELFLSRLESEGRELDSDTKEVFVLLINKIREQERRIDLLIVCLKAMTDAQLLTINSIEEISEKVSDLV